jgi:hypothetical protein
MTLRDKVCNLITRPDNAALLTHCDVYFYLAQIDATTKTIGITLGLQHLPVTWPGAVPGFQQQPIWPGVQKREVYRQFDQLIHNGTDLDTEAMPWNRKERDVEMSD